MFLINALEVFDPKDYGTKRRLGRDNDGGYIVLEYKNGIENRYDRFISCGISDDISFEIDFLNNNSYLEECLAFDGSIDNLPVNCCPEKSGHKKINFYKNFISGIEDIENNITNLHSYIKGYKNIFLKMDIEGHEFNFLNSLSTSQLRSFKQIVIEFHFPIAHENNWNMLNKLRETHWLVHLHPNNNCGTVEATTTIGKIIIPNVFECTYIRKPFLELSKEQIPSKIDMPNEIKKDEIILNGYPYVSYN